MSARGITVPYLFPPALVAGARDLGALPTRAIVVAVQIVPIQAHDRLCHLLWGVRRSRRRLKCVVRRVECCTHLVSRRGGGVHHLGPPLEVLQGLLQLEIRVGVRLAMLLLLLLLLLCGRCFAVLVRVEPSAGSHLRFGIVGIAGGHLGRGRAGDNGRCASTRLWSDGLRGVWRLCRDGLFRWCCERAWREGRGF